MELALQLRVAGRFQAEFEAGELAGAAGGEPAVQQCGESRRDGVPVRAAREGGGGPAVEVGEVQLGEARVAGADQRGPRAEVVRGAARRKPGRAVDGAVGQAAQAAVGDEGDRGVGDEGPAVGRAFGGGHGLTLQL